MDTTTAPICSATGNATSNSSHLRKPSRSKCRRRPDPIGLPRPSTPKPRQKATPNGIEKWVHRTRGGQHTAPIRPRHVPPSSGDPPFARFYRWSSRLSSGILLTPACIPSTQLEDPSCIWCDVAQTFAFFTARTVVVW
ncbi:hypothetical protein CPAR01_07769 [Colletotrichum paranaense]|uniref:Uncharacterized protein n=1 Tax=Colletotrichum paranaense TaxID=1914294 RepID=A0ABQ9SIP2_9PEZI|nr:uncharacterized protein CPAR01_07769 [Colletotrichum paranaense]KAK1537656.1 hypothetical protein CPAR01_07769 [Colletotrichum paranaense]